MTRLLQFVPKVSLLVVLSCYGANASAQNYPASTIHIVTSEAGGGTDIAARIIAQSIAGPLGQSVVVDNRNGVIATETVAKAAPDGLTMLLYGPTTWLLPFLRENVSWDPIRDFIPVSWVTTAPNVLVVNPMLPAHTVREFIALAKARPGELNYSSGSGGSSNHLAAELFKSMTGTNLVRVPYKGIASAINAVIGNEVQLMFPDPGTGLPHVKSGRVRALGITSAAPSSLAPGIPTIAESGVPGYEAEVNLGVFVPAKTPAAIVNRLNQELVKVLSRPDVRERLFATGVEAVGSTQEQFAAKIKGDMNKMGKVIKEAGIRVD